MKYLPKSVKLCATLASAVIIAACSGDGDDNNKGGPDKVEPMVSYMVEVINASHAQPMSPPAVILHGDDYQAWSIGSAASVALEDLAESGSPAMLVAAAQNSAYASVAGDAVIPPGMSGTITVTADWKENMKLSLATMLVNTNDAFVGLSAWDISSLEIGDTMKAFAPVYDAGTEANSETAASIPGPAAGGEGTNAEREAHDFVTRHPGVVTQADGYEESALTQAHRFDNNVLLVKVTRQQ